MELSDLIGKHNLAGVDMWIVPFKEEWQERYQDAQAILFELDGVSYQAIEDPEDGYRSMMREIQPVGILPNNRFAPVEVLAVMRLAEVRYGNDILDMYDTITGKLVLSVGTDHNDDYYPSFVAEFTPENMAPNQGR